MAAVAANIKIAAGLRSGMPPAPPPRSAISWGSIATAVPLAMAVIASVTQSASLGRPDALDSCHAATGGDRRLSVGTAQGHRDGSGKAGRLPRAQLAPSFQAWRHPLSCSMARGVST